ncbi:penicillin-binding protein activator [Maridesulfovibrio ferrireducens]|uniref:penicillin-binding protein activator n=1 Tax=Maridesulfovibrio ferrireducens TaxID=246191 RepID=UPI001A1E2099|nr:penicillin-binding protein activator [Maridesulfovibrio ferrireducens]MBI9111607.1 penicillin-binding protein activator [Maridesulfovibrio ferrireducens]
MNHEKSFRLFSHIFALVLVAAILSTTTSCVSLQKQPISSTISTQMLSTNELIKTADQAWFKKDYIASELYYTRLLERTDVPKRIILPALERLSVSSYKSGHYHEAKARLEQWKQQSPEALSSEVWQKCYFDSLFAIKNFSTLRTHLAETMENGALPWDIRSQAGKNLSSLDQNEESLAALERLYSIAPNDDDRKELESWFITSLGSKSDQELKNNSELISGDNNLKFPYELILFEKAIRQSSAQEYWPMAWRTMSGIVHRGQIVDKHLFNKIISTLEAKYGIPRVGIALVLPISGRFQDYGWKIIRGAGAAQWELTKAGLDVDVQVINTEEAGWVERVQNLPPWYTVLGGPINVKAFKELEQSETYAEKVTFSFLAKPGNLEEGKQAWRFFSSPEDQIRASLDLAINDLGITDFAVLYPQEKFGRQMSKIFWNMAKSRGAKITGMESYPPNDFPKWGKVVGKLVKAPEKKAENEADGLDEDAPLTETDFGAVFIPDTWRQAQLLIPHFFFHEADTLVFLGPELWSQALNSARDVEAHNLKLTVAPGAWWSASEGAVRLKEVMNREGLGTPDFWVALGYDFIKFSSKLGTFSPGWTPEIVNERIADAQHIDFSLAPIHWDADGKANQKLFLFRPERNGKTRIDASIVKSTLANAKNRRAQRIKAWDETQTKLNETNGAENKPQ